jgi:hypothetical protein
MTLSQEGNMRRCLAVVTVIGALIISSPALAKKEKTGVLEKELFSDSLKGYQFTLPYNWKLKTEKEPSLLRATLQKIKLEPLPAGGSQGYYNGERYIPTIKILVDTTSLGLEKFCELLLADKSELPRKKEYWMKLDLLVQSALESHQRVSVGGEKGLQYTLQKKFLKVVQDPRQRSQGATTQSVMVEESLIGYLIVCKKNQDIFMIQSAGERATFEFEDRDYQKLLETWKFIK